MKVWIMQDGKTAMKYNGNVCVINGLMLRTKTEGRPDIFYPVDDPFFKLACPPKTEHEYETLPNGKINLL